MNPNEVMAGVAVLIKDGQTKIIADVQHTLAGAEMERREAAIIEGLRRLPALEEDVKAVAPDVKVFNATGEQVGEAGYSEHQLSRLNAVKGTLDSLTAALNKALNDGEYDDLFELTNGPRAMEVRPAKSSK